MSEIELARPLPAAHLPRARATALVPVIARVVGAVVGIGALALLSLAGAVLLGHDWLTGPLKGNDSPHALTQLAYLQRWGPPIPDWFHAQGGGTYFLKNYAPGAFVPLWLVGDALPLTPVQLYRLAAFLAVPLTALGIGLLAWLYTRRVGVALLAVPFFLVSSMSWGWLTSWGFYAQVAAFSLAPFAVLALHRYLVRGGAAWLALAAVTTTLMATVHPISGFVFVGFAAGLAVVYAVARLGLPLVLARRTLLALALSALLGGAFWLPFFVSIGRATERGLGFLATHDLPYLTGAQLLGLPTPDLLRAQTAFHPVVVALFLLGFVVALRRRERLVAGLGALAIGCMVYTALPTFAPAPLLEAFARAYSATNVRAILPAVVLIPIVAGFGAVALGAAAVARVRPALAPAGEALAVLAACALVIASGQAGPQHGPAESGLSRVGTARLQVDDAPSWGVFPVDQVVRELRLDGRSRIDVSLFLGGVAAALNVATDASQVNLYYHQSSLIHAMWGYEQAVLFLGSATGEVRNVVDWFGIERVLVHTGLDRPAPLERAGLVKEGTWGLIASYAVPDAAGMVTVGRGPAVLVIGDRQRGAHESVFQAGSRAGLGYADVLLVDGGERVDAYDAATLRQFDAVLLYGYHAGDRARAWRTLADYVAAGGAVFVDTGWQFVSDDWQARDIPAPSPVAATEWRAVAEWRLAGASDPLLAGVDLGRFGPPRYGDAAWGVSTGAPRGSATVVLRSADLPLLARERVGEGTVIWSGMNLIGHYRLHGSEAEARLLANIVRELAGARRSERRAEWERLRPERVAVRVGPDDAGAWVLFREALVPEWRATVDGRELRLWKAGPGFVAARLPERVGAGTLVIEQRTGAEVPFGLALTLVGAAALAWPALRGRARGASDETRSLASEEAEER